MLAPAQGGLQVWNSAHEWRDIVALEGSLVVTTGKMLMALTNAKLRASWHRVIDPMNQSQARYSMPFFVHAKPLDVLEALPRYINQEGPRPLPTMTRAAFMAAVRENTDGIRDWLNANGDRS